jgi:hypothetical protein
MILNRLRYIIIPQITCPEIFRSGIKMRIIKPIENTEWASTGIRVTRREHYALLPLLDRAFAVGLG